MGKNEDIAAFLSYIQRIEDSGLEPLEALQAIRIKYRWNLREIVESYYDNKLVFTYLFASIRLKQVVLDIFDTNPAILDKRLYDNKDKLMTVATYFSQQPSHPDIYTYLQTYHPEVLKTAQTTLELLKAVKEKAAIFSQDLKDFINRNDSLQKARDYINSYDPKILVQILEEYHEGKLVFSCLVDEEKAGPLLELITDLVTINPNILEIRLSQNQNGIVTRDTLLTFLTQNSTAYSEIYTWVKTYHPIPSQKEQQRFEGLNKLRDTTYQFLKNDQWSDFQRLFERINSEIWLTLLCLYDNTTMWELLLNAPRVSYLTLLVTSNVDILRLRIDEDTLLELLCSNPLRYGEVLNEIADTRSYREQLSEEESQLIREVIFEMRCNDSRASEALSLLTVDQLEFCTKQLAPFNEELYDYIDTDSFLDISILNATVARTCRAALASKHIAVMTATRSIDAINVELFKNQFKDKLPCIVNISIADGIMMPVIEELAFEQPIHYVALPVHIDGGHYGLLILNLMNTTPDSPYASQGTYIEPFASDYVEKSFFSQDNLTTDEKSSILYEHYVADLTEHLQMRQAQFNYVFLDQREGENYCSDYVIAILILLASGVVDLNDRYDLGDLSNHYLKEDMVRRIRMLEVQLFGPDYLKTQLPYEYRSKETMEAIDRILQSQHDAGEPEAKKRRVQDEARVSTVSIFTPAKEKEDPVQSELCYRLTGG